MRAGISRRSLTNAADTIRKSAAGVGLFFLLCGLAEHPSVGRIAIELGLMAPFAASLFWSALPRIFHFRRRASASMEFRNAGTAD